MIFKLGALILVLLITFFQSLTGLFSALIMFILTLASASLAFGLYETLYESLLGQYLPAHGHAVALIGVFLIVLAVTRVLADTLIKKNMEFPGLIDRIGGGVFGFCSAMIMTGMLAISIQLLPFGRDILGFERLVKSDEPGRPMETRSLWLSPDGFAVRLVSLLSRASFGGSYAFDDVHPDFLAEIQRVRYGPQKESCKVAPTDLLRVQAVWPLNDDQLLGGDVNRRGPGHHWLCVRASIASSDKALDSDRLQRAIPMQFRLVGWPRERGRGETVEYHPIGMALRVLENTPYGEHQHLEPDRPFMLPTGGAPIDLVFEVPREFVPWFLEFKRGARAEISPPILAAGAPKPEIVAAITEPEESGAPAQAGGTPPGDDDESGDRVSGRHVRAGQSRFDRSLPVSMEPSWMIGADKAVSGSQFRSGHIVADWPLFEAEPSVAVTGFLVPDGMQLFQLSVTRDEAQSIFGRALSFARNTLGQFVVRDEEGQAYFRLGEIRIADVSGQRRIEMQYWPEAEIPERCIRPATAISDALLKGGDYTLIYLYLIPEGRKPVEFDTGNRIRKIQ